MTAVSWKFSFHAGLISRKRKREAVLEEVGNEVENLKCNAVK